MKKISPTALMVGCMAFSISAAFFFSETAGSLLAAEVPSVLVKDETLTPKPKLDPIVLKDKAMRVMETYCFSCHGPEKQKGDIRFDALDTIDPVDQQDLFAQAKKALHLSEMPPPKAKQPADDERAILMQWLDSQVSGDVAKALAEKLKRFEYGNVVNHDALFSGKYANLATYTPDRRWMISEYIFNEQVNRLLDYQPTRTIYGQRQTVSGDSGIHWSPKSEQGNKFRRTITNPFLLSKAVGVRYSGHEALTDGHLLTMIGNAKIIAGHMTSESTMKAQYPAMYSLMQAEIECRQTLRSREQFLTTYTYMERLLSDIYGAQHKLLLPPMQRLTVPDPKPVPGKDGKVQIETNLALLERMDPIDLTAVYRGINSYQGQGVEYDHIIERSERDWFMEGVAEARIQNRVSMMKALQVNWDMKGIIKIASDNRYSQPKYVPLKDAEMAVIVASVKKNRTSGDTYQQIIDKCLAEWEAVFKAAQETLAAPDNNQLGKLVRLLYEKIYEREPTQAESEKNIALLRTFMAKVERQTAIGKLIESLILNTEFMYRYEFGQGEADQHGRRMMSPRDASYALAFALTDSSPDAELAKAVKEGRLNTRADYEREIRRMLARRDIWTIIDEDVQAKNLNPSVTNQPIRKLRFFRDFFGFSKASSVFKDDERFGAGRHEEAVSRLIDEADLLIEHLLEQDKNVFEQLLTTDQFYVFHSGDNQAMQSASDTLKAFYQHFKDYDWPSWGPAELYEHKAFLKQTPVKGGQDIESGEKNKINTSAVQLFKTQMQSLSQRFGGGQQNAVPFYANAFGFWNFGHVVGRANQHMRGENVTTYWNLNWRTWDYPTQQPAKIPNRMGMLTHPAWLIAHAQNLETDPIHRGKWIREKLLAGTIPDVPITVDAVIPPDHTMTMRQRMEGRTGTEYCWRCHQNMDPLGFPFELYDDFGRFRNAENLEHPDNLLKKADPKQVNEFGAALPVYKTLPVNARGVLQGTGDAKLDGDVKDAFDLIARLAKSDKVRQSIIRHAFRYFMGRNETLSDSKTLIDAEKAYLTSNGSFDHVIVSLLTSDSFIYRKAETKD